MKRIIVGISGASGVIYSIRLLQILKKLPDIETHLVITQAAKQVLSLESSYSLRDIISFSHVVHDVRNISASISSGSFRVFGMVVLPCSIKTLSSIVYSYTDNLLVRSADVVLKEKKKLILCVRETPLHLGHLRTMIMAIKLGAIIMPPMPAFYFQPRTIQDLVDQTVNRILDQLNISLSKDLFMRWKNTNI